MTTFRGGPANGQTLHLQRSPKYLRVVVKQEKNKLNWDALDQLVDAPAADERIFVYRATGEGGNVHIDGRDPKTGKRFGRWESIAEYEFILNQPDDATLRDRDKWREWCENEARR